MNGDEVMHGKPHPEIYQRALQKLDCEGRQTFVIEDTVNGIHSAHDAGCPVVGLTTTFPRERLEEAGADMVIDQFKELLPLFAPFFEKRI